MTLKMVGFVRPFQANFVRLFSTVPQSRASFFIYAPIFYGEDGTVRIENRLPLLMLCFKSFLICTSKIGGASYSICLPFVGHTVLFPTQVNSQISHKMRDFRDPRSAANGIQYCENGHPLLMKCFKSFLICISKIGGALDSICLQVMEQFVPLPTNINSQISPKM